MAEQVLCQQRVPGNKGMRYPADPPTVEEIVAVMREAGAGRSAVWAFYHVLSAHRPCTSAITVRLKESGIIAAASSSCGAYANAPGPTAVP